MCIRDSDCVASAVAAGPARRGEVQVVALHTTSQAGRDCRRRRVRDAGGKEGEFHVSAQEGGRVRVRVAGSLRQQGGCRAAVEGQGRARVGFVTVVGIAIHQTSLCPLTKKLCPLYDVTSHQPWERGIVILLPHFHSTDEISSLQSFRSQPRRGEL